MQTNEPPNYNNNNNNPHQQHQQQQQNEAFLLNLTPLPTKASFLTGRETLEGELQLKQLRPNHYSFRELSLSLIGLEERSNESLELINQPITLWKPTTTLPEPPPSLSPFRFTLPPDLPQCIHLSNHHGIKYHLTACLTYQDHQTLKHSSLSIPIHIPSTYTHLPSTSNHPAQLKHSFSLSPVEIKAFSPTPIFVSLSQTLLTHSQPIALQIRIPPPTEQLINDKGLQLRNVRAELRRHIRSRSSPQNEVTTVLAISGKSCRFSSSRAVFLRLRLHSCLAGPGTAGTEGESVREGVVGEEHAGISRCERLSQTTGLFEVGFSVVVRVQIMGAEGTRHDHELVQEVGFVSELPSTAGCLGKAREAAVEAWYEPDAAPTYLETELRDVQASTSQLGGLDLHRMGSLLDWQDEVKEDDDDEEEEEYDGYESFSAMAGQDGPAPPTIDEDESPPPAPDTPPEGLALQLPTLFSSEPDPYLPDLLHPGITTPHHSNSCHHAHMYSFPLPDSAAQLALHSRPTTTELDPVRPPAYAPGWSSLPLPHHPPSLLPLPPHPVSSESSSAEPPPYAANCS